MPGRAIDTASRYFQNMILFLIVYTAIRERKHAIWLAWAWLAGATFATVPAILNPPTYEDDLTVRISGTIGDPNELAALLVAGMAFAGVLAVTTKEPPRCASRRARRWCCSWSGSSTPSRAVAWSRSASR